MASIALKGITGDRLIAEISILWGKMTRFRRTFVLIMFNFAAVSALFILLEACVRIFLPEIRLQGTDSGLLIERRYFDSPGLRNKAYGFSNEGFLIVDENGFRRASKLNDFRKESILLLGDSVTMGIGVDNDSAYAGLLQNFMPGLNILNPSLVGYDLRDYNNLFRYYCANDLFRKFNITTVLVCWCLNDIYLGDIEDKEVPGGGLRNIFGRLLTPVRKYSKSYVFIKNLFSDRPKSYYEFDKRYYLPENKNFMQALSNLSSMSEESEKLGLRFIVLLLPYEYQLRNYSNEELFRPQRLLGENLNREGIRVLDPKDFLIRNARDTKDLYLYADGIHFSEKGHRLLARYLHSALFR